MKYLLIVIIVLLSGCAAQDIRWAKSEGLCVLTEEQKELAWKNVVEGLIERHPEHSEYCEIEEPASKQAFRVVNGVCRVYLACAKSVNGGYLLHGDWIVEVNAETQQVLGYYDVAW